MFTSPAETRSSAAEGKVCRHLYLLSLVLLAVLLNACGDQIPQRSISFTSKKEAQRANVIQNRKVYKLSVVPAGVYSGQELAEARVADAVVAAHYSDFGQATRGYLPADSMLYVSYRIGDRIYWTARPHRIPKGEAILTDGTHMARVRCGNRLSVQRQNPVSKEKDPTEVMLGELQPPETDFLNTDIKPPLAPPEMDFAVGRGVPEADPSSFPSLSPNLSIPSPASVSAGGLPSVFAIPTPVSPAAGSSNNGGGSSGGTNTPGGLDGGAVAPEPGGAIVLLGLLLIAFRLISLRKAPHASR